MSAQKRRYYLDALRIVACLAVAMIHVSGLNRCSVSIYSMQWEVFNLFECISRWAVPVFVMISGALFLKSDKPIRAILRQNVSRLAVAYLAWGAFYAWFEHPQDIGAFLMLVLTGHFHMWYIPMLVGLYLVTPLLRPIARDKKLCTYFLLLSFVFAIGVPFAGKALALVSPYRSQQFVGLIGKLGLKNMVGFSLYFVLGYYLDNLQRRYSAKRLALLLAGALASIVAGTVLLSFGVGTQVDLLLGTFTPGDFAAASLVFLLVKNCSRASSPRTTQEALPSCACCLRSPLACTSSIRSSSSRLEGGLASPPRPLGLFSRSCSYTPS